MTASSSSPAPRSRLPLIGLGLSIPVFAFILLYNPLRYTYQPRPLPATFEEFYQKKLQISQSAGTRPGNEERLERYAPKTPYTILYIHGFGASRAEGEIVVDTISAELKANTYYLRLPGHGTNMEDHAAHTYADYLDLTEESFAAMKLLGDRVIIIGSSTGALLATYLAAEHPDDVAAVILTSPLYEFRDPTSVLLTTPGGMQLIEAVFGDVRDANWKEDPENRKMKGYEDYWITMQKTSALQALGELRKFIARDYRYERVTAPALLMYYYKNEQAQDETVSVPAMLEAFAKFGKSGTPHPANRAVAVEDGNHILLSEYVRTDKALILNEIRAFLNNAGIPGAAR